MKVFFSALVVLLLIARCQAQDVRVYKRQAEGNKRLGCEIQKVLYSTMDVVMPSDKPRLQYAAYCKFV